MRKSIAILLIVIIGFQIPLLRAGAANEDRITELRKQIEELEHQAEQYRDNIAEERTKQQNLKGEIALLKKEVVGLETQISLTTKKIDKTKIEITDVQASIFDTQQDINKQRETIGELLQFLYRHDNQTLLATLVKNDNISNFLTETQQVDTVNNKLLGLIQNLKDKKQELEGAKQSLEGRKSSLVSLNEEQAAKKISLLDVKSTRDNLLVQTKNQEANYQKMLNEVEQRKTQFFIELQKLENRVITGGKYIVRIAAKNLPPKGTNLFIWPEDKYRTTQGYGMTTYARRGAYGGAGHNGIDIAGGFGTPIKAIGAGTIIANGKNSGWGNWVAIKHPPYDLVSVYGHMSALSALFVGTEVKQGQVIGYEGSTGNSTGSHLHISLYKEFFTYVNEKKDELYFNYFEGSINPNDYLP